MFKISFLSGNNIPMALLNASGTIGGKNAAYQAFCGFLP